MDTSETYIKMCDCLEIQGIWQSAELVSEHGYSSHYHEGYNGSFYAFWDTSINVSGEWVIRCVDYEYDTGYDPRHIWLPRQDELQGMVPEFTEKAGFVAPVASHFADFAMACANNPLRWELKTFEQLWLAFYMWELHSKKWDGETWKRKRG